MKTVSTLFLFFIIAAQSFAQYGYDTVKVYFPINITVLSKASQMKLDSVAKIILKKNILIYGYADYLGKEPSNLDLAIGRANNVKQYLLSKNVPAAQILICEGIGQINRNITNNKDGVPEDRRVDIFIKSGSVKTTEVFSPPTTPGKKTRVAEITTAGRLVPVKKFIPKEKAPDTVIVPPSVAIKKPVENKPLVRKKMEPAVNTDFEKLTELKPNDILRVETIHFIPTRHFITEDSEPILIALLKTMQEFPNLAIRIEGHVCCVRDVGDALDTDTYELKLSVNRARHIYAYLVQNGIDSSRLEYAGFGKSRPVIAVEMTEEDAQKNRRVEIRVLRN